MVVTLYYYEGLTLKEIGAVLGVSESVCQIHGQAIIHLRSRLNPIGLRWWIKEGESTLNIKPPDLQVLVSRVDETGRIQRIQDQHQLQAQLQQQAQELRETAKRQTQVNEVPRGMAGNVDPDRRGRGRRTRQGSARPKKEAAALETSEPGKGSRIDIRV